MSTYTQCLHHIVFATKHRRPALVAEHRRELFFYITGVVKRLGCHLYRVNGVDDHLHLLVGLHPSIGLAEFVKQLKIATGNWMRAGDKFPAFAHWQEGYGAFTVSWERKAGVIAYIRDQEEHHRHEPFLEEFRRLVVEAGLEWDEQYLP